MKKLKVLTCAGVKFCLPKKLRAVKGECPADCIQFRYTFHTCTGYKSTHDVFIKSDKQNAPRERFLTLLNKWNQDEIENKSGYTFIGVL